MREIGARHSPAAVLVELQNDLIAIVSEAGLMVNLAVPVAVDRFPNTMVLHVVEVIDHFRGWPALDGVVRNLRQPLAGVPGVFGDVRIARVEHAVVVVVDELFRAVAFGIVGIGIGAVRNQPVVRATTWPEPVGLPLASYA